jgi:AcrR family transcriptional regulator
MTPTAVREPTRKRPYLRPADRRRQLLDAAARVFDRGGLAGITMVAVAAEAGVSRRLVYDHFDDLSALYEAYFDERLARYLAVVDRSALDADVDVVSPVAVGLQVTFRQSPAVLAAVDLIVRDTTTPELEGPRRRLRAHLEERWLPVVDPDGVDPQLTVALLWTVLCSVLALANQVAAGQLDVDRATALALALVGQTPNLLAIASAATEEGTTP